MDARPEIRLSLSFRHYTGSQARKALESAFSLHDLETNTLVVGSWNSTTINKSTETMVFSPKAALGDGSEYKIEVKLSGTMQMERPVTLFRVGSLPRVTEIVFGSSQKKGGEVDRLDIFFSETINPGKVKQGFRLLADGKASTISLSDATPNVIPPVRAVSWVAKPAFDPKQLYELRISPDVGAPKKLDSEYKGTESTVDFVVKVTPTDLTNGHWVPDLKL